MPILNYSCRECGKVFAKIFFSPADAPKRCPVCGAETIQEEGATFDSRGQSLARWACDSCDVCGVQEGCAAPRST